MKKREPVVHCVIVASELMPGFLSIRSVTGGKGGHLKKALTDAGFQAGDVVTISLRRGEISRPQVGKARGQHDDGRGGNGVPS